MSDRTEYPTAKLLTESLRGEWNKTRRCGKARCPAHDDSNPSLDITQQNGRTLVICRSARCSQHAVLDARRAKGLWPERRHNGGGNGKAGGARTIVVTYSYQRPDGSEHFQVVRFAPQDFRPRF